MSKRILILLLIISSVILTFCTKKSTSPEDQLLPPTNLTISLVENNKIQINWIDNSTNETAYLIDRKMGTYNWLENLGEVAANITSFTDNIPTNSDTVFSYRIRAFDDENFSAYSDTIAWFSLNSAPTNLQVEQITQDTLKLTWQDNSIGEQYFRIDRKIDEKGWQIDYAHVPADTTHFLDYTTALYDTCNYKVFAVSGISHSDSTENSFIPFLPAPTNFQLQPLSATEVTLTWQDNCHNEDGYRLFFKRGEISLWESLNLPENTEEFSDENVIPGIMNYYKICAYYENDTSGFIFDEINTLPAPSNLTCTQQNVHTFELTWNDNSQFEQGFKIDRKIDEEEWVNNIHTTLPNAMTWIDSTIGRSYNTVYYRLYAYYETYCSDNIETNSNITFPAPSNLDYEKLTIHSIKLTWNDNSQGETGFKIDKKVGANDWQNNYAIVSENIQEWTDENTEINETLQYRIHAYCGNNVSDNVITNEIDNAIPAPTDLSYQKIDIHTIKLEWTDNSIGEQGFKIDKKVGEDEWQTNFAIVDVNIEEWTDENAEINETIQYRVYAYYEEFTSSYILTDEIDNSIPAPSNVEYEILSPTSIHLTWDDNSIGEQGFKIDKKVGEGDWQNEYAILDDNIIEWTDENAELNDSIQYILYTYYENFNSDYSCKVIIPQRFVDIDGNVYQIIQIGTQWWMMENLKVTHYRNGDPIPEVTDNNIWSGLNTGAYCNYDNNVENVTTYGRLYNWYSVNDVSEIAPEGWHVPDDDEWQTLVDYLGEISVAGGKMKEAGFEHWNSPNTGATNESGFTALPSGCRFNYDGNFSCIGKYAFFWSSTEYFSYHALSKRLYYDDSEVGYYGEFKENGFSVRCIRN